MDKGDVANKRDNLVVFKEEIRHLLKELVKSVEHLNHSQPKLQVPRMLMQIAPHKSPMRIFRHRM